LNHLKPISLWIFPKGIYLQSFKSATILNLNLSRFLPKDSKVPAVPDLPRGLKPFTTLHPSFNNPP